MLLDVEGTTTPLEFVASVLLPYAGQRMAGFLHDQAADPEVKQAVAALRREHAAEAEKTDWDAAAYACWLIDRDRKSTPLEALQGRIWEAGFRDGTLRAPVYDDVPPALATWTAAGRRVAIFSSGSVLAQRLLFAHTTAGDLGGHLSAYFDTTTGPKREPQSYTRIAGELRAEPYAVQFLSDVAAELDAAAAAGLLTALCVRPGTPPPPPGSRHPVIRSFDELL
jgi:enolase-phosphatase E1